MIQVVKCVVMLKILDKQDDVGSDFDQRKSTQQRRDMITSGSRASLDCPPKNVMMGASHWMVSILSAGGLQR